MQAKFQDSGGLRHTAQTTKWSNPPEPFEKKGGAEREYKDNAPKQGIVQQMKLARLELK